MTKMKYITILAALTCSLVFGQPGMGGPGRAGEPGANFFDMHDANDDGQVTSEEFLAQAQTRFADIDENGDGVITGTDFDARRFKMAASRMLLKADTDESGTVTAAEWTTFVEGLQVDEDGAVDPDQFHGRRRGHGERGMSCNGGPLDLNQNDSLDTEDLAQVFATMDKNEDQVIAADELESPRCFGRHGHGKGHGGFGKRGSGKRGR